ncbi:hypothetical protein FJR48_03880 [Sulfurimonas lithotrophica]|uniref:Lipopolysaccharide biosynthesis protein n=1 Tax=Sulfurimonas lithotrophica TaxID=2590022 RepID=A0A5P8NZP9_9BACT|nr:Wzz/FepE/Etk N-terminal domain-containing protein [Sulfurimonas lithotrophica]QFR48904.1 hypothetical protein FJR48_03880 [Sulfurimonas lithotrophica]
MQENQVNQNIYQEDEIDLKELVRTLWVKKTFIIIFTTIITLLAITYAFFAPKVYEAKVIFKIGEYKQIVNNDDKNTNTVTVTIANASELTQELEILYIDLYKNVKDREAKIDKVGLLKRQKNLFEVVALGNSNNSVTKELKKILKYVQEKHIKILNDIKNIRESQIEQLYSRLIILKTKTLPTLKDRIDRYNANIQIYEQNFKDVQNNIKKIKNKNPTLATIQINEQKYLADMLITLHDSLEELEAKKDNIELIEIAKIEEELNTLKSLMEPHNYKNTDVIGDIMTNDSPVKPKKKLIVIVAFVTGFILSIFLVFFMEFIRGFREEKAEQV